MSWGYNVQLGDYSQYHGTPYLKVPESISEKFSPQEQNCDHTWGWM